MRIGDLVELSAKGKNLKYCNEYVGKVGIISGVDYASQYDKKEWFYVDWCGGKKMQPHLRTDLKYAGKKT
jgi:hypothetical protein